MQAIKKSFTLLGNIIFVLLMVFLIIMVFFVVKGKVDGGNPSFAGHKLYIVLSGSMAPVFDAGSVIGIKDVEPAQVAVGDIITFKDPEVQSRIVTHRVVEVIEDNGGCSFVTKGDANEENDQKPVPAGNVVGRATFWVPYAGYVFDFAGSKKGLLCLIVIPGVLFIMVELRNIFKYAREYEEGKKREVEKADSQNNQLTTETENL